MNCVACELYISLGLQNQFFYTAQIYQVVHEIVMPVLQCMSTFHKRKEKNREREREREREGGGGGVNVRTKASQKALQEQ